MLILGIDPGKTGGAALINQYSDILEIEAFKPVGKEFDIKRFINMLKDWAFEYDPYYIYIEKVHSMPKQGVVSMFDFGKTFGQMLGSIETFGHPYDKVPATIWAPNIHKSCGCDAVTAKQKSLQAVDKIWPGVDLRATKRSRTPHSGIVDALLIAEYGRRVYHELRKS